MTMPTMKPRIMRTQAGIVATSMRPPSPYDPAPGTGQAPWATGATQTPGQPGAPRFTPLAPQGPGQTQAPARVQTANTGRQAVGSSYGAGTGLPQVVGGSVAASAPRAAPTLRSPTAQATFGSLMANADRAARAGQPTATGPARVLPMPQQGTPAPQGGGGGGGGAGTNPKGPSRHSNKPGEGGGSGDEGSGGGGIETGSSGSGLAPDANGDGQPDTTADDTPDGGQELTAQQRRARAEAAGYDVSADGDVYTRGVSQEWVANINDDASWSKFSGEVSQVQGSGDVDLSGVPEEGRARAQAIVDSGQFWIDERTGDVYLKDASGAANPDQNTPVGNIYDGNYSGKAKAIADSAAADDGQLSPEEILQQILDMQPEQQTDEALNQKIAADQQSRQYAAAQALQSAMAAGGRARMGAGWMAGMTGDIGAQENLASAQGAADLRLEHERSNLMARMDMVNRQIAAIMAMAGYADNQVARDAAAELSRLQQSFQMQLDDLNYRRSQQIGWKDIFGLGGNLLGGAAGGFVNWMMK